MSVETAETAVTAVLGCWIVLMSLSLAWIAINSVPTDRVKIIGEETIQEIKEEMDFIKIKTEESLSEIYELWEEIFHLQDSKLDVEDPDEFEEDDDDYFDEDEDEYDVELDREFSVLMEATKTGSFFYDGVEYAVTKKVDGTK